MKGTIATQPGKFGKRIQSGRFVAGSMCGLSLGTEVLEQSTLLNQIADAGFNLDQSA